MSAAPPADAGLRRARRLLWLALPLLGAGYQVAAKEVAGYLPPGAFSASWLWAIARQPWTLVMLALEIASFFAWLSILARIKLSEAFPLSAVSYVLVILAGWTLFHEPFVALQALGGLAILGGVWFIGRGAHA